MYKVVLYYRANAETLFWGSVDEIGPFFSMDGAIAEGKKYVDNHGGFDNFNLVYVEAKYSHGGYYNAYTIFNEGAKA